MSEETNNPEDKPLLYHLGVAVATQVNVIKQEAENETASRIDAAAEKYAKDFTVSQRRIKRLWRAHLSNGGN